MATKGEQNLKRVRREYRAARDRWLAAQDKGGKGGKGGNDSSAPEGLNTDQQNAYDALVQVFIDAGLVDPNDPTGGLAATLLDLIQHDYGADTITLKLQESPAYAERFKANETRKANNIRVLNPAEYLEQERQYRQALQDYGLPKGFYDSPDDFAAWIGKDVSINEIRSRAEIAAQNAQSAPPEVKQALAEYYGIGDGEITAYFLDRKRTVPLIEQQARAAQIGGAAISQGLATSADRAFELSQFGITQDQARQGYSAIGQSLDTLKKLSNIDKMGDYTQTEAEDAFLKDDAKASKKVRKLASNERARFSGDSGIGSGSLSTGSQGSY